jgi:predicted house-cleaning NTP pyrophosphatase (Maf/HAM1 superfamily)
MLLPYLKYLNNKIVILGSQSKSRNELMTAQHILYKVIPSKFEEDLDKTLFAGKP